MLEGALVAGALSAGGDVYAVGVLPTPAIAYLTRRLEAHGGVVLSASHNPFEDNGIKIFSSEGAKFPDAWEEEIETRLGGRDIAPWPTGVHIGRLVQHEAAEADYIDHARACCPHDLRGLHVVLDCAHGATYRVAPEIFRRLGADVRVMNASPDGRNINLKAGALHPEALEAYPNVTAWLRYAQVEHREAEPSAEFLLSLTEDNVVAQLKHLRSHPTVAARLEQGDLALHGWVYHIGPGTVTAYDEGSRKFATTTSM